VTFSFNTTTSSGNGSDLNNIQIDHLTFKRSDGKLLVLCSRWQREERRRIDGGEDEVRR